MKVVRVDDAAADAADAVVPAEQLEAVDVLDQLVEALGAPALIEVGYALWVRPLPALDAFAALLGMRFAPSTAALEVGGKVAQAIRAHLRERAWTCRLVAPLALTRPAVDALAAMPVVGAPGAVEVREWATRAAAVAPLLRDVEEARRRFYWTPLGVHPPLSAPVRFSPRTSARMKERSAWGS